MRSIVLLAALAAAPAAPAAAQALQALGAAPAPNAIGIPRSGPIDITFDRALDPATVTPAVVRVMGRWSGVAAGALTLHDGDTRLRFTPAQPFSAGEIVTMQISRALAAADGQLLDTAHGWTWWAAVTAGGGVIVPIDTVRVRLPGEGLIISYGGSAADFNGDGWSDLLIANEAANDVRMFLNDGAGGYSDFTVWPLPGGSVPSPVDTGDFDADGDVDAVVANLGTNKVHVLLNDGAGAFPSRVAYTAGQTVRSVVVLDLDGDGIDELVTANNTADNVTVLTGQAGGTFSAPVALAQTWNGPHALAVADVDGDGVLDVYLGNRQAQSIVSLRSNGLGALVPAGTASSCGGPWQVAAGDLDNDGDADVATSSYLCNVVTIHLSNGAGGFLPSFSLPTGSFVIAIDMGDLDGDGDLDIVTSNYNSGDFRIHENLGGGSFAPARILAATGAGSCALLHDRDNDGDLDITGVDEIDDLLFIYRNDAVSAGPAGPDAAPAVQLSVVGANPSRTGTVARVELAETVDARLSLFDAQGRRVRVVHDGALAAGRHDLSLSTAGLAPGVYVLRLESAVGSGVARLAIAR